MLKFFFVLMFMIPFSLVPWINLQIIFFILFFLYMYELGSFFFIESLSLSYGIDLMSYMLVMLSIWLCIFIVMSSEGIFSSNYFGSYFHLVLLMLMLFLMMSFYSTNLVMFYIYFESSLIPTFMIIMGWGYQSERVQAGIYLLMYTLISSLPLFLMILYYYEFYKSLFMYMIFVENIYMNVIIYLFMFLAFMVKLPMFMLHLWLPKAHVEAPVSGSMILAGVLLKLGGYGSLRLLSLIWYLIMNYTHFFIIISLIGGVLISVNCLRQSDMKLLIAYSSVSHMGIMLAGLMSLSFWGVCSSLSMMLSHGLCSSALFYLANICYERIGTRSLYLVKGMIHLLPKICLWWFLFCAMNMACPPSLNLLSEIGLINAVVNWSFISFMFLMLMGFFVAGYSLYLFSFSQHGKCSIMLYSFYTSNVREYYILFMHWLPLNLMILMSELFMIWL